MPKHAIERDFDHRRNQSQHCTRRCGRAGLRQVPRTPPPNEAKRGRVNTSALLHCGLPSTFHELSAFDVCFALQVGCRSEVVSPAHRPIDADHQLEPLHAGVLTRDGDQLSVIAHQRHNG